FVPERAVEIVGEDAPVALEAAVDAALDLLADLVELLRMLDGHGAEDDLVGEGEDGGGGSDAEGEGEDRRDCKARSPLQSSESISQILRDRSHFHTSLSLRWQS